MTPWKTFPRKQPQPRALITCFSLAFFMIYTGYFFFWNSTVHNLSIDIYFIIVHLKTTCVRIFFWRTLTKVKKKLVTRVVFFSKGHLWKYCVTLTFFTRPLGARVQVKVKVNLFSKKKSNCRTDQSILCNLWTIENKFIILFKRTFFIITQQACHKVAK